VTPALRTVGNIITGSDEQTQCILDLYVVPPLLTLLSHSSKNIRKEACWTISNVMAGSSDQIQLIIIHHGIPKLMEILRTDELVVQDEAVRAIYNATSGGSPDQIIYLVQQGAIAALCNLLTAEDSKIITVVLKGLENILKSVKQHHSAAYEHIVYLFSECSGLEKIECLQDHTSTSIYKHALKILRTYFAGCIEAVNNSQGNTHLSPESAERRVSRFRVKTNKTAVKASDADGSVLIAQVVANLMKEISWISSYIISLSDPEDSIVLTSLLKINGIFSGGMYKR